MISWLPLSVEDWPLIASHLAALGQPWPEGAAIYDLRLCVVRGVPIPGRRTLAQRWAWGEWRVRALLADTDRWSLPSGLASHLHPTTIPPASHPHPTPERINASSRGDSSQRPPTSIPPASQRRPALSTSETETETKTDVRAWAPQVIGAHPRAEYDAAHPDVAALLALQEDENGPLFQPTGRQVATLIRSLLSGRTVEWHRRLFDLAVTRRVRLRTWERLLSPSFAWLTDALERAGETRPHVDLPPPAALPLRLPD